MMSHFETKFVEQPNTNFKTKFEFSFDAITIVSKEINENGTYNASKDGANGYNPVKVNVPTYEDENKQLHNEVEQLNSEIEQKKAQVASLEQEVQTKQAEIDAQVTIIGEQSEQIISLQNDIKTLNTEIDNLNKQIVELEAEISKQYEAGKQEERETFWETYQRGGRRNQYRYAFYDALWTDVTYNPIYPIVCVAVSNDVYSYCGITDTKVDIDFSHASSSYVFRNCASLKTIKKLIVTENVAFTNWFINDTALENIVIEGVIGKSIDLKYSPLTVESMKSVISCLKNYAGTSNEGVYEVSFSSGCWEALESSGTPYDDELTNDTDMTWKEYVINLGWLA